MDNSEKSVITYDSGAVSDLSTPNKPYNREVHRAILQSCDSSPLVSLPGSLLDLSMDCGNIGDYAENPKMSENPETSENIEMSENPNKDESSASDNRGSDNDLSGVELLVVEALDLNIKTNTSSSDDFISSVSSCSSSISTTATGLTNTTFSKSGVIDLMSVPTSASSSSSATVADLSGVMSCTAPIASGVKGRTCAAGRAKKNVKTKNVTLESASQCEDDDESETSHTADMRKVAHVDKNKERKDKIKDDITELRSLLPDSYNTTKKQTQHDQLQMVIDYMKKLKTENSCLASNGGSNAITNTANNTSNKKPNVSKTVEYTNMCAKEHLERLQMENTNLKLDLIRYENIISVTGIPTDIDPSQLVVTWRYRGAQDSASNSHNSSSNSVVPPTSLLQASKRPPTSDTTQPCQVSDISKGVTALPPRSTFMQENKNSVMSTRQATDTQMCNTVGLLQQVSRPSGSEAVLPLGLGPEVTWLGAMPGLGAMVPGAMVPGAMISGTMPGVGAMVPGVVMGSGMMVGLPVCTGEGGMMVGGGAAPVTVTPTMSISPLEGTQAFVDTSLMDSLSVEKAVFAVEEDLRVAAAAANNSTPSSAAAAVSNSTAASADSTNFYSAAASTCNTTVLSTCYSDGSIVSGAPTVTSTFALTNVLSPSKHDNNTTLVSSCLSTTHSTSSYWSALDGLTPLDTQSSLAVTTCQSSQVSSLFDNSSHDLTFPASSFSVATGTGSAPDITSSNINTDIPVSQIDDDLNVRGDCGDVNKALPLTVICTDEQVDKGSSASSNDVVQMSYCDISPAGNIDSVSTEGLTSTTTSLNVDTTTSELLLSVNSNMSLHNEVTAQNIRSPQKTCASAATLVTPVLQVSPCTGNSTLVSPSKGSGDNFSSPIQGSFLQSIGPLPSPVSGGSMHPQGMAGFGMQGVVSPWVNNIQNGTMIQGTEPSGQPQVCGPDGQSAQMVGGFPGGNPVQGGNPQMFDPTYNPGMVNPVNIQGFPFPQQLQQQQHGFQQGNITLQNFPNGPLAANFQNGQGFGPGQFQNNNLVAPSQNFLLRSPTGIGQNPAIPHAFGVMNQTVTVNMPQGPMPVNMVHSQNGQYPSALMLPNGQIVPVVTQPNLLFPPQQCQPVSGGLLIPANPPIQVAPGQAGLVSGPNPALQKPSLVQMPVGGAQTFLAPTTTTTTTSKSRSKSKKSSNTPLPPPPSVLPQTLTATLTPDGAIILTIPTSEAAKVSSNSAPPSKPAQRQLMPKPVSSSDTVTSQNKPIAVVAASPANTIPHQPQFTMLSNQPGLGKGVGGLGAPQQCFIPAGQQFPVGLPMGLPVLGSQAMPNFAMIPPGLQMGMPAGSTPYQVNFFGPTCVNPVGGFGTQQIIGSGGMMEGYNMGVPSIAGGSVPFGQMVQPLGPDVMSNMAAGGISSTAGVLGGQMTGVAVSGNDPTSSSSVASTMLDQLPHSAGSGVDTSNMTALGVSVGPSQSTTNEPTDILAKAAESIFSSITPTGISPGGNPIGCHSDTSSNQLLIDQEPSYSSMGEEISFYNTVSHSAATIFTTPTVSDKKPKTTKPKKVIKKPVATSQPGLITKTEEVVMPGGNSMTSTEMRQHFLEEGSTSFTGQHTEEDESEDSARLNDFSDLIHIDPAITPSHAQITSSHDQITPSLIAQDLGSVSLDQSGDLSVEGRGGKKKKSSGGGRGKGKMMTSTPVMRLKSPPREVKFVVKSVERRNRSDERLTARLLNIPHSGVPAVTTPPVVTAAGRSLLNLPCTSGSVLQTSGAPFTASCIVDASQTLSSAAKWKNSEKIKNEKISPVKSLESSKVLEKVDDVAKNLKSVFTTMSGTSVTCSVSDSISGPVLSISETSGFNIGDDLLCDTGINNTGTDLGNDSLYSVGCTNHSLIAPQETKKSGVQEVSVVKDLMSVELEMMDMPSLEMMGLGEVKQTGSAGRAGQTGKVGLTGQTGQAGRASRKKNVEVKVVDETVKSAQSKKSDMQVDEMILSSVQSKTKVATGRRKTGKNDNASPVVPVVDLVNTKETAITESKQNLSDTSVVKRVEPRGRKKGNASFRSPPGDNKVSHESEIQRITMDNEIHEVRVTRTRTAAVVEINPPCLLDESRVSEDEGVQGDSVAEGRGRSDSVVGGRGGLDAFEYDEDDVPKLRKGCRTYERSKTPAKRKGEERDVSEGGVEKKRRGNDVEEEGRGRVGGKKKQEKKGVEKCAMNKENVVQSRGKDNMIKDNAVQNVVMVQQQGGIGKEKKNNRNASKERKEMFYSDEEMMSDGEIADSFLNTSKEKKDAHNTSKDNKHKRDGNNTSTDSPVVVVCKQSNTSTDPVVCKQSTVQSGEVGNMSIETPNSKLKNKRNQMIGDKELMFNRSGFDVKATDSKVINDKRNDLTRVSDKVINDKSAIRNDQAIVKPSQINYEEESEITSGRGFALSNFIPVRSNFLESISGKSGESIVSDSSNTGNAVTVSSTDKNANNNGGNVTKLAGTQIRFYKDKGSTGVVEAVEEMVGIDYSCSSVANIGITTQTLQKERKNGKSKDKKSNRKKAKDEDEKLEEEEVVGKEEGLKVAGDGSTAVKSFTLTFSENDLLDIVDQVEQMGSDKVGSEKLVSERLGSDRLDVKASDSTGESLNQNLTVSNSSVDISNKWLSANSTTESTLNLTTSQPSASLSIISTNVTPASKIRPIDGVMGNNFSGSALSVYSEVDNGVTVVDAPVMCSTSMETQTEPMKKHSRKHKRRSGEKESKRHRCEECMAGNHGDEPCTHHHGDGSPSKKRKKDKKREKRGRGEGESFEEGGVVGIDLRSVSTTALCENKNEEVLPRASLSETMPLKLVISKSSDGVGYSSKDKTVKPVMESQVENNVNNSSVSRNENSAATGKVEGASEELPVVSDLSSSAQSQARHGAIASLARKHHNVMTASKLSSATKMGAYARALTDSIEAPPSIMSVVEESRGDEIQKGEMATEVKTGSRNYDVLGSIEPVVQTGEGALCAGTGDTGEKDINNDALSEILAENLTSKTVEMSMKAELSTLSVNLTANGSMQSVTSEKSDKATTDTVQKSNANKAESARPVTSEPVCKPSEQRLHHHDAPVSKSSTEMTASSSSVNLAESEGTKTSKSISTSYSEKSSVSSMDRSAGQLSQDAYQQYIKQNYSRASSVSQAGESLKGSQQGRGSGSLTSGYCLMDNERSDRLAAAGKFPTEFFGPMSSLGASCAMAGKDAFFNGAGTDFFGYPAWAYGATGDRLGYPPFSSSALDYAAMARNPFMNPFNMDTADATKTSTNSARSQSPTNLSSCRVDKQRSSDLSKPCASQTEKTKSAPQQQQQQGGGVWGSSDQSMVAVNENSRGSSGNRKESSTGVVSQKQGRGEVDQRRADCLQTSGGRERKRMSDGVSDRSLTPRSASSDSHQQLAVSTSSATPSAAERSCALSRSGYSTPALHHHPCQQPASAGNQNQRYGNQYEMTASFQAPNIPTAHFSPNLNMLGFDPPPLNFSSSRDTVNPAQQRSASVAHFGGESHGYGGMGGAGNMNKKQTCNEKTSTSRQDVPTTKPSTCLKQSTSTSQSGSSSQDTRQQAQSSRSCQPVQSGSCKSDSASRTFPTPSTTTSASTTSQPAAKNSNKNKHNRSGTAAISVPPFYDIEAFDSRCLTPYIGIGRTGAMATSPTGSQSAYFPPSLFGGSTGSTSGRSTNSSKSHLQHRDSTNPFFPTSFQASSFGMDHSHHLGGSAGSGYGGSSSSAHGMGNHAGFGYIFPSADITGSGMSSTSPLKYSGAADSASAHHAAAAAVAHQSSMMYHHGARGAAHMPPPSAQMLHDMASINGALMFGAAQHAGFEAYPFMGSHGHHGATFGMGSLGFPAMHNIR